MTDDDDAVHLLRMGMRAHHRHQESCNCDKLLDRAIEAVKREGKLWGDRLDAIFSVQCGAWPGNSVEDRIGAMADWKYEQGKREENEACARLADAACAVCGHGSFCKCGKSKHDAIRARISKEGE